MNSRRYSKYIVAFGTSMILLSLLVNSARAATGGTRHVSIDLSRARATNILNTTSSSADNIYPNDANLGFGGLFPNKTVLAAAQVTTNTGATTRVSISSDGTQANGGSESPSISADGRYVAFSSSASNLVDGDTNSQSDVFIRDLQSGTIELISRSSDGTIGNGSSTNPTISADGRFIAYASSASNLVNSDSNNVLDIFLYDRQTKITKRVSLASDGTEANNSSSRPTISGDGRFIAFVSSASNLSSGCANCTQEIFLNDQQTGMTREISHVGSYDGGEKATRPSISEDGSYIAYDGGYYGFGASLDVYIFNRQTSSTLKIPDPSGLCSPYLCDVKMLPAISADGRYVVYYLEPVSGLDITPSYLYLYDQQTSSNEPILYNTDGSPMSLANGYPISISADGRYIVFISSNNNLVPGYTFSNEEIFVRDRQLGVTEIASIADDGTPANANSDYSDDPCSCITQDGRIVVFDSYASNLVPADTNNVIDVFIRDRQAEQVFYSLSGHIQDEGNNNLSGVTISAIGPVNTQTTTDSSGNYTISWLTTGTYLIYANKTDYLFNPYPLTVILDSNRPGQNILGSLSTCILTSDGNQDRVQAFMCSLPTAKPFLNLPFSYTNFVDAANATDAFFPGKVTAWVDHDRTVNKVWVWSESKYSDDSTIYSYNCYPPRSHCYDQHEGTDFALNTGSSVFPAAPGVVAEVCRRVPSSGQTCSLSSLYGNYVLIDHENGYATLYAHLASVSAWVQKNIRIYSNMSPGVLDPLGIVGHTGCDSLNPPCATHLHFGLLFDLNNSGTWTSGEEVDPYGPTIDSSDPMGRPNIYMWKYPLYVNYCYNPSTEPQTAQFDKLIVSFPPDSLTSDTTVSLGIGSLPGVLLDFLRSASQSYFLNMTKWLPTGLDKLGTQPEASDLPSPFSISIAYDPESIPHLVESQLTINRWDDLSSSWIALPTTLDTIAHNATSQIDSTGSFILQAPLICPADTLEPNDNFDGASLVQTNGTLVSNLFDISQDEDWFKFDATAGVTYNIQTTNLTAGVDTILEIYNTDGITLMTTDDNSGGGLASRLLWQAPAGGTYFVRVKQGAGSIYGCDAAYNLSVISPTISGNAGVAGATLKYTDGIAKNATADGSGNYSFRVSYNWSGTVIPDKAGYTFIPANNAYINVQSDQTDQNFTAHLNIVITGNVGGSGVTLAFTVGGINKTVISDVKGNYTISVPPGWTGIVTPSKICSGGNSLARCYFTPAKRSYTNVQVNQKGQNYILKRVY